MALATLPDLAALQSAVLASELYGIGLGMAASIVFAFQTVSWQLATKESGSGQIIWWQSTQKGLWGCTASAVYLILIGDNVVPRSPGSVDELGQFGLGCAMPTSTASATSILMNIAF